MTKHGLPDAEDVNYWKTSSSAPDSLLAKTRSLIEDVGGSITVEVFGRDGRSGHGCYHPAGTGRDGRLTLYFKGCGRLAGTG